MISRIIGCSLVWGLLMPLVATADVDYARDIQPVLSDNCYRCHGPDAKKRKGGLRLDVEAGAKTERDGVRAIMPGNLGKSELVRRILSSDPDEQMPPPDSIHSLTPREISLLQAWIKGGAKWGGHWAFARINRPAFDDSNKNPVDVFLDRRLKEEGIPSNPRAKRETLIRRLSLDLTGLPPSREQVDAFLADKKQDAWERLVNRTLDLPSYGERMAWDWLEAARYADSNGYQGDKERTMWPWRDWVVQAFNNNLPYDKFTIWQLAGDLLPEATQEQILATGFNRNHMINGEGGRIAEENRVDYVFDMTETMGTVWLGLTLNCCRCHDHKFDPLLQREYYQLNAFFNQTPVNGGGGNAQTPPVLSAGTSALNAELTKVQADLPRLKAEIDKHLKKSVDAQAAWEAKMLEKASSNPWHPMQPSKARANRQTLEILDGGFVYASGENPDKDEYQVSYPLREGRVSGFLLDAVRHPKMTDGGLARSDSGNFVLTDLRFELVSADDVDIENLEIATAQATFEQGTLKVKNAFDNNPASGWAVWSGKSIDRDHAAVFRLKKVIDVPQGFRLRATLKFNSPHKHHHLGHFRFSSTDTPTPSLNDDRGRLMVALRIPLGKRNDSQRKTVREAYQSADAILAGLRSQLTSTEGKIKSIRGSMPKVMVMADMPKPRQTFMLDRGLYSQRGDVVDAAVPAFLPPFPKTKKANRLALARWLVSRDNPLTSRVTVNRFWQMLFGVGLVKTTEDFGVQAEYPVHPELLDWLSVEFIETGWDLKGLLRTILTSEAYQRSSRIPSPEAFEQDPENRLHARGPRFRMPSWMIRDQALGASGLLNPEIGGAPVNGYQPAGVWEETSFGKKKYRQDTGSKLYRRSLYTFWRRIVGPTIFFDSAKRQICEVKPLRTNTPLHALTTLNDTTYVEAARALAGKVLRDAGDDESRIRLACLTVLSREPALAEIEIWRRSLARSSKSFTADPDAAKRFLSHGEFKTEPKRDPLELAAWTALCVNLLNLDESLNKE
jgi:mono/diheme cytochrome c family protein